MTALAAELAALDPPDIDHRDAGEGLGSQLATPEYIQERREIEGYPSTLFCHGCWYGLPAPTPGLCPRCGTVIRVEAGAKTPEEAMRLAQARIRIEDALDPTAQTTNLHARPLSPAVAAARATGAKTGSPRYERAYRMAYNAAKRAQKAKA